MASRSINICSPLTRHIRASPNPVFSKTLLISSDKRRQESARVVLNRSNVVCSATQESSAATVADAGEAEPAKKEAAPAAKAAPAKPKKAPAKPLPEMMAEDVIPSLRATLEAQKDLSEIEVSFQDNTLEGSFLKNGVPHCFWAFFPNGTLIGPKGFSLSSYGTEPSTVEPFLIDERNIKAKQVAFWVAKRLAAQGILPVE